MLENTSLFKKISFLAFPSTVKPTTRPNCEVLFDKESQPITGCGNQIEEETGK